ncbi:MAG TPA: putative hydro-lyase [Desulfomonilaceae bacterium]|nr:putative hydro-lyase [Desulfomonilaceae bacterium]
MTNTTRYDDPKTLRASCRQGLWSSSTSGQCAGYVQANLVILPRDWAFDFLLFCHRNPKPCPILEVTDPGDPVVKEIAPHADLRTDLPAYRVFRDGEMVEDRTDISDLWQDDSVGFLIGCSYTFDSVLEKSGFPQAHVAEGREPGIYVSNISCRPAGRFKGPMVVTARSFAGDKVADAVMVTSRFTKTHGAPVYVGDPSIIGIDLTKPDPEYGGHPLNMESGKIALMWACGITPQAVAKASRTPFMITHKPGHMFVSDLTVDQLMRE